jgi:hypothetical protein
MISSHLKYLLFIGTCWVANLSDAQTTVVPEEKADNYNSIGFGVGPILGYLKDKNYSPLNYRESGIVLSLFYENVNRKGNRIIAAQIDYASGKLKTDAGADLTTSRYEGNIEISMLFRISPPEKKRLVFFAGPHYNSFAYYMQWGDERDAWNYLMVHSLNLKGFLRYNLSERKSFRTTLSIPVIENLVRPPYNGFDQFIVENQEKVIMLAFHGKLASFKDYRALDWKTSYRYTLSSGVDFNVSYLFRFQQVTGENKLVRFQNQLAGGFTFKF